MFHFYTICLAFQSCYFSIYEYGTNWIGVYELAYIPYRSFSYPSMLENSSIGGVVAVRDVMMILKLS